MRQPMAARLPEGGRVIRIVTTHGKRHAKPACQADARASNCTGSPPRGRPIGRKA